MTVLTTQQESAILEQDSADFFQSELMRHFKLLSDQDQLMVRLACEHGVTHRQLATILRTSPGTITRRLHRIIWLLRDPLVLALAQPDCDLPPLHRRIALEHLLHRWPIARIARRHRISDRQVRRMLEYTRGWMRAQETKSKNQPRRRKEREGVH